MSELASTQQSTQRMTLDSLSLGSEAVDQGANHPNAVMYAWFQLFKTAQIHAIDNQALLRPIQTMVDLSHTLIAREGRVSLQAKDRALFMNSTKLKLTTDEYELANGVFEFFEERGMGGFTIEAPLTADVIRRMLAIFVYAPPAQRRIETIDAALKAAQIPLRVNKPLGTGNKSDAEVVLERRSYTFFTYSKLVVLYRSLLAEEKLTASRRSFLMKKIARTVQAMVDICLEDDHTFLGAASVKTGEAYDAHHAANVAVLAIALGEKIGMSKVDLADLGLAAVFHDVGLRACPSAILEKAGPLEAGERAIVEQHPIRSVEFLLEERKFNRSALSRIVAAFEHHRHFTPGGGYPLSNRRPDLFSRLIAIADVYDALTANRPWRKALLPDEALGSMLSRSGKEFDPALMKIFVNTIGLYPVGTLVRMDTGEFGIVVYGGGEGERVSRPIVTLVGRDGRAGATVDLMQRSAGGQFLRTIVSSEDPAKYGLQPSGLIAACGGVTNG